MSVNKLGSNIYIYNYRVRTPLEQEFIICMSLVQLISVAIKSPHAERRTPSLIMHVGVYFKLSEGHLCSIEVPLVLSSIITASSELRL